MTEQGIQRQAAFGKLRRSIHEQYELNYDGRDSRALIVVFSPNPRVTLREYPFRHDCLFIADRRLQYYTHNPTRQTMKLHGFIERCGYDKVAFVGSSKGGAGALLWSSLLVKWNCSFSIYCLAFSPQTLLYPYNDNLASLPSYVNNMRSLERDIAAEANFRTYGDISKWLSRNAAPTLLTYSAGNKMDCCEAERLDGIANVQLNPIDLAFHGSITPFVFNFECPQEVEKLAAALYANAEKDVDLRAMLPKRQEDFPSVIRGVKRTALSQLIDQFCDLPQWG